MQNKIILFSLLQFVFNISNAQLPIVNSPIIPTPTQTVYLDPNGNDSNAGTFASPKKTFYAAINSLSFGIPNKDGGNAYGEVVFKSGNYYLTGTSGITQDYNNWRAVSNGVYVYKNISIKGLGNVILHGDSLSGSSQMIYLRGSGIKVSNIKIKDSRLHGVAIIGSNIKHHSNVVVDSVFVDGAIDNGIWITGYNNVLVQNCSISNTCLRNYNSTGDCHWASACRVENSNHATVINNEIFNNWGEGLNMSLVRYANIKDNRVYNNYSVNIYCNSTSNAVYSHNLSYNTDSTFWRNCVGNGKTSADDDFPLLQPVTYFQTDSVYVFNNIVLNASISIWDAFSGFNNFANLTNFFISHNTVIGVSGQQDLNKPLVNISMLLPFVRYSNVNISKNLFSADTNDIKIVNLNTYVPNGTCNLPWQTETFFSNNMWNKVPNNSSLNLSKELQNSAIIQSVNFNNLAPIIPNASNPTLIYTIPLVNYITDDYFHNPRNSNTNIGAIETSVVSNGIFIDTKNQFISPNPVTDILNFNEEVVAKNISIYNINGEQLYVKNDFTGNRIDVSKLKSGIYFLVISDSQKKEKKIKFVKL
ncbi:MAG: T9SS type A sorting domain-containing protein [Candidatus Kapabacteria bacterium]|nr:T9SS type A sorting domain-containing protein [Candidatus Kapabacteria bacterium]